MHRGGSVRIREFVTRFTRFSLEIRKTNLFSFRVFSKKSKKRIKGRTEGSIWRTFEAATTGTPVDTLRALVEFCWRQTTTLSVNMNYAKEIARANGRQNEDKFDSMTCSIYDPNSQMCFV